MGEQGCTRALGGLRNKEETVFQVSPMNTDRLLVPQNLGFSETTW